MDFRGAQILTGNEEGSFGWITINYLLETLIKVRGGERAEEQEGLAALGDLAALEPPHCYWALRLGPRGSQSLLHGGTGKPGGLEEPQKQWGLWIVGPSFLLHHSLVREASSPGLTLNQVHAPCE